MADRSPPLPMQFSPEQAADGFAIQQRIYFYGWCIDHRAFEALDAVFDEGAEIHYDTPGGHRAPWSEMRAWLPRALRVFRCTQHNMANPMVSFDGGADVASSTTYGYLAHYQESLTGEISIFRHSAIYRDEWVRRDGLWRIRNRTLSNIGQDGPVFQEGVKLFEEPVPV